MEKDQFKCPGKQFIANYTIKKFYALNFIFNAFLRLSLFLNSRLTNEIFFQKFKNFSFSNSWAYFRRTLVIARSFRG